MSVLVDRDIMSAVVCGLIIIDPFDMKNLGTNSYDVHLAPTLRIYKTEKSKLFYSLTSEQFEDEPLDTRMMRETIDVPIPDGGFVLMPGELYLASTVERTESHDHVPILNGRSSLGRLGLSIHVTAGTGDVGFCGHWTMEMFVVKPLRVYAGMPVGQLLWLTASGPPATPYGRKASAKYAGAGALPQASKLHEELGILSGRK